MKRLIDYFLDALFPQYSRESYSFKERALIQKKRMTQTREELLAEMLQSIDELDKVRANQSELESLIHELREMIDRLSKQEPVNQAQLKELESANKRLDRIMSKLRSAHAIHA